MTGWGGCEFLDSFAQNDPHIRPRQSSLIPFDPKGMTLIRDGEQQPERRREPLSAACSPALCTFVLRSRIGSCKLGPAFVFTADG